MTIDGSWLRSFKSEVPHAFVARRSNRGDAVFTDGQIRLNKGGGWGGTCSSWDDYVWSAFGKGIEGYFKDSSVVILAFDNYDKVPRAKCMTQEARKKRAPPLPFSEHCPLPPSVPTGEHWMAAMANRTFKMRVIEFVLLTLPARILKGKEGKTLIVDYHRPEKYSWDPASKGVKRETLENVPVLGEADVKFTRWAETFGSLLVDSIDGDTIPIALMFHERELSKGLFPPAITVYRMALKDENAEPAEKPAQPADKKRKRAPQAYEYVDISALHLGLSSAIHQSIGRTSLPLHEGYSVRMLVSLIGLTGTDFSRGLPLMSGRSVFDNLPHIWMTLAICFDTVTSQLRTRDCANRLVALLYHLKFQSHVKSRTGFPLVLAELQGSKLSERTKRLLPSLERVENTVRNVNWLLSYWSDPCACPDPVQEEYGYKDVRGATRYLDD